MIKGILVVFIGLAVLVAVATVSRAERFVVMNGQRLANHEILQLERYRGAPIANGNYWINGQTGVLGYPGNPRPVVQVRAHGSTAGWRRPSLTDRGALPRSDSLTR